MTRQIDPRLEIELLQRRIGVLEARNGSLRAEVERLVLGRQPAWTAFQEANGGVTGDGKVVRQDYCRTFLNSRYQVSRFDDPNGLVHLSIKRTDGSAVHDWRDFQRIKNELIGPEEEAVEIYPAEERLVDGANQYHLFCVSGHRIPFGFGERLVSDSMCEGVTQRAWDEGERPADCQDVTNAQLNEFREKLTAQGGR